jgi:poly-gamma-glutamate capsule biosynthesis protein CapA/YwtB (metallophosphatase superfamily)
MSLRLALAGDCLIVRNPPDEATQLPALAAADTAFCNIETLFHEFEWPPMATSGGLYVQTDPAVADALPRLNIGLAALANNHSGDYGAPALLHSREVVESVGVKCAGAGATLAAALAPAVTTHNGTRIALVSATSTFPEHARAADPIGPVPGRPGVNTLRFTTVVTATDDQMRTLETVFGGVAARPRSNPSDLLLPYLVVTAGEGNDVLTLPHPQDLERLTDSVRRAAGANDVVLVSIHTHERARDGSLPPLFVQMAARHLADAGATAVVCHGAHVPGGIEWRAGTLILYGLGNLFFELEHISTLPADAYAQVGLRSRTTIEAYLRHRHMVGGPDFLSERSYWESYVAVLDIEGGKIAGVTIHPIDLGLESGSEERGRPRQPSRSHAASIIETVRRQSAEFGTEIRGDRLGCVEVP